METKGTTQIQRQPVAILTQQSTLLQRSCACGQHTVAGGECKACRKSRESGGEHAAVVPIPFSHTPRSNQNRDDSPEHVSSPGESRFAHDFSQTAVQTSPTPKPTIQAKLEVNQPGDAFEQEADEVAEQVTQHPLLEPDSRRRNVPPSLIAHENGDMLHALKQQTAIPLSQHVRQRVEPVFGVDLGHVRVHTDPTAHAAAKTLRAKAFTHQNHIWLGTNQDADSLELMAHEATHVVQQSANPTLQSAVQRKDNGDSTEDEQPTEDKEKEQKKAQQKTLDTLQPGTETASPAQSLVSSDAPQPISPEAQKAAARSSSVQAKVEQHTQQSAKAITSSLSGENGQGTTLLTDSQDGKQVEQTKDKHAFVAPVASQTLEKPALVTNHTNTIQRPVPTSALTTLPRLLSPSPATPITDSSQGVQDSNLTETSSTTQGLAASAQHVLPTFTPNVVAGIPATISTAEKASPDKEENEKQQKEIYGGSATPGPGAGAPNEEAPRGNAIRPYLPKREPTFEEFFTMLEAGHTIEQDRMEAQRRLAILQGEAEKEKAAILQVAETQKTQITTDVEAHITSVQTAVKTQTAAIHTHFATNRSALRNLIAQEKVALEKQVTTEIDKIEGKDGVSTKNIDEFEKQLLDRQRDMTNFSENESKQPPIIANEEGERATKELEKTALEAEKVGEDEAKRYPGEEDPKPAQRQAARELANQSAADIREKKAPLMDDMRIRANNFTGNYMDYAKTVNVRITETGTTTTPVLKDLASNTIKLLRDSKIATLKVLDDRLRADLQVLSTAEAQAVTRIKTSGEQTIRELRASQASATNEVSIATTTLTKKIDDDVQEVSDIIDGEEQPFLPGITDIITATQANMTEVGRAGIEQLNLATSSVTQTHSEAVDAFTQQGDSLVTSANNGADIIRKNAQGAISKVLQARTKQAEDVIKDVDTQQKGMAGAVLTEVDKAAEEAKGKVREINTKFRSDLREAADKSVEEGKKPRVDLEKRVHDAAKEAGEAWYIGLLKAVGEILVGLIIVIVVALVIAGIAAFFGVFLTAWTAMMLAGALLLAIGLVLSTIGRYQQLSTTQGGGLRTLGKALLLGVSDTVGITGIIESYTGKDILTGKRLSSGERTRRGVTGAVSLIMIVLGVRGAIKGPPGGLYTRSPGVPRSWSGFGEGLARAWRGVKTEQGESIGGIRNLALELYNGVRENISDLNKWLKERISGPSNAPEEPGVGPKPERGPNESEDAFKARQLDWLKRRTAQRVYEQTVDRAVDNARLDIKDADNQAWWDRVTKEDAPSVREKRLAFDPDHKGIISDQSINEARVGLLAEEKGIVDGPIRRPTGPGEGEFYDAKGQSWDVKSGPRSGPETVADDLLNGRNILIDREGTMTEAQFRNLMQRLADYLRAEPTGRGKDIIPDLFKRVKPVPPFADIAPPVIPDKPSQEETSKAR